jgi:PAS domain S-box-containing protein
VHDPKWHSMRVLIVEDEAALRKLLATILEQRGHQVTEAADAETGLALYKKEPFPFVVTDWLLPGMSGLDLTRVIRAYPDGAETFVLLSTGRDKADDLNAALHAGADDFIAKPMQPSLMSTRLAVAEQVIAQRAMKRQAELALKVSEQRFAAVFQRSPSAIVLLRAKDHAVLDANDAFCRLFGVTREGLFAASAAVLAGPGNDWRERLVGLASKAGGAHNEPLTFTRLNTEGASMQTLVSIETIEINGDLCLLTTINDVTERERLREQLLLADRMVSVGTLAAGVAHEINNPLHYIMTNLGFLSDELSTLAERLHEAHDAEDSSRKLHELAARAPLQLVPMMDALAEAREGSDRVRHIVSDLKTFSRTDERVGAVNVHDVIENAINLAQNEIKHRARLIRDYQDVPLVHGNAGRLIQVFVNLLVNASHAIPEGDAMRNAVRIRTNVEDEKYVSITLADTGKGIEPEHLKRIFDPFFTTKAVGVGTGLGLSICHAIINSFGGRIQVESEVGRGTTVRVTLERAAQTEEAEQAERAARAASAAEGKQTFGRRGRILVIDDEVMIGKSLLRALSSEHDIQTCTSARDGIDALRVKPFDLILCDLMMPDMTGMEFHGVLKDRYQDYLSKVVFLTGGAFTTRAKEFVESAGSMCLEKPLDMVRLKQLIRGRLAA